MHPCVPRWLVDPWETKGVQARETTCGPLGMQSAGHASGMACVWRQGLPAEGCPPAPTERTVTIQRKQEGLL